VFPTAAVLFVFNNAYSSMRADERQTLLHVSDQQHTACNWVVQLDASQPPRCFCCHPAPGSTPLALEQLAVPVCAAYASASATTVSHKTTHTAAASPFLTSASHWGAGGSRPCRAVSIRGGDH
jgi:hypothetical protein